MLYSYCIPKSLNNIEFWPFKIQELKKIIWDHGHRAIYVVVPLVKMFNVYPVTLAVSFITEVLKTPHFQTT